GPGFPGADGVQVHMTNTRITDPETVEHRYPIRLEQFAIRRGSGGNGHYSGGDGLIRSYRFLAPMDVSVVSERRGSNAPFGLQGGEPGTPGRNTLIRNQGKTNDISENTRLPIDVGGKAALTVEPGDFLIIETPGGGGFGASGPLPGDDRQ
ncbi:hydantoinase B/oxoprolinase family protein, partial [bacterium]|nr:hydantoinase B/oxoprolinase family protein [candidate division CSSED10-310 bacterium]